MDDKTNMNPFEESQPSDDAKKDAKGTEVAKVSLDAIAKRLVEENFVLTALELHTELVESGRELRRLRDYFSNPVHFEQLTPRSLLTPLGRTSSVQTFDSFDGEVSPSEGSDKAEESRITVLEFELRKANEIIRQLRGQLTEASATCSKEVSGKPISVMSASTEQPFDSNVVGIRAHEKRALNFLINEYLLQQELKLTAVTLSDEVGDQDFEIWDDVGLNIARPASLVNLYREFCHVNHAVLTSDFSCNVSLDRQQITTDGESDVDFEEASGLLNRLNTENAELLFKKDALEGEVSALNEEVRRLQKALQEQLNSASNKIESAKIFQNPPDPPASKSYSSCLSGSPKMFLTPSLALGGADYKPPWEVKRNVSKLFKEKLQGQCLRISGNYDNFAFLSELLNVRVGASDSVGSDIVQLFAKFVPKIVPNVLLNKREELIPVIVCTAMLHSDPKQRDQLLNCMFNLTKKPEEDYRDSLLCGCAVYAQRVGPLRTEAELLPLFWEQMNNKHAERRLLVAEACGVLAPFIPPSLLSSLVLSMLQQLLCEDKSEHVREAAVKSLAVLCLYIDDADKFGQMVELLNKALSDTAEVVVAAAEMLLLPGLCQLALEWGKLQLGVVNCLVRKTATLIQSCGSSNAIAFEPVLCSCFRSLKNLTPFLFWSVLSAGPYVDQLATDQINDPSSTSANRYSAAADAWFDDLNIYAGSRSELMQLTAAYDTITLQEWYKTWDALDFIVRDFIPGIIENLNTLDVSLEKVVHSAVVFFSQLCRFFGRSFVMQKVKPLFVTALNVPQEQVSADLSHFPVCHATLPVFVVSILANSKSEDAQKELLRCLKASILQYSESNGFTMAVVTTFGELICAPVADGEFLLVLAVFCWELVVHKSPAVRQLCARILQRFVIHASESLLKLQLLPALITLASDSEVDVRIATLQGFGALLERCFAVPSDEILEKVKMQLSTFLEDSSKGAILLVSVVKMLAQVAPAVDSKLRDDFVLPRLAIVAAHNYHQTDAAAKQLVAHALFEAYSALSCCFLSQKVILESFLPGVKSLYRDCDPAHANILASIIKDFENKVDHDRTATGGFGPAADIPGVDVMRTKMIDKFKDLRERMDQTKDAVPSLFKKK